MNQHFGKLADVWKHLVLAELLVGEEPARYAETHAGSARYQLLDDAERRFGVGRFVELTDAALTASAYRRCIAPHVLAGHYLGSAAIATLSLPSDTAYVLCDLDPVSAADLRAWARAQKLVRCQVVERDGLAEIPDWLDAADEGRTVVHIDPFDPHARSASGYSATTLAHELIRRGITVAYWYGYDAPEQRGWPVGELAGAGSVWCGDVMVVNAGGDGVRGDLGEATTAGTGSGMVLANVAEQTIRVCEEFGVALEREYDGAILPDGSVGGVRYQSCEVGG